VKPSHTAQRPGRARKIIVFIATSADGFIARPDGGVEWLNRPRRAGDYGMGFFFRSIDTIIWGRKTYELALRMSSEQITGYGPNVGPILHNLSYRTLHPTGSPGSAEIGAR
jgi:hypothetical protein